LHDRAINPRADPFAGLQAFALSNESRVRRIHSARNEPIAVARDFTLRWRRKSNEFLREKLI
jgi:hypothetical protein